MDFHVSESTPILLCESQPRTLSDDSGLDQPPFISSGDGSKSFLCAGSGSDV